MEIGDEVSVKGRIISIDKSSKSCLVLIDAEDAHNLIKVKLNKIDSEHENDWK